MPLHWAASGGHSEIVKFLLGLGVPFDGKDDVSSPPFCIGDQCVDLILPPIRFLFKV